MFKQFKHESYNIEIFQYLLLTCKILKMMKIGRIREIKNNIKIDISSPQVRKDKYFKK